MARWRRLCVDIGLDDEVIGASIEWFEDRGIAADAISVLAKQAWNGMSVPDMAEHLLRIPWVQGELRFPTHRLSEE